MIFNPDWIKQVRQVIFSRKTTRLLFLVQKYFINKFYVSGTSWLTLTINLNFLELIKGITRNHAYIYIYIKHLLEKSQTMLISSVTMLITIFPYFLKNSNLSNIILV